MVLFVLRKLILQTVMRNHPMGLDVGFLIGPFVYFHVLCVRTAKALVRLRGCAGSPEPSLIAYEISTIISWTGSFHDRLKSNDSVQLQSQSKVWLCHWNTIISILVKFNWQELSFSVSNRKKPVYDGALICAASWENLFMPYANNKSTDQPAHPCSVISALVVRCLAIISLIFIYLKFQASSYLLWLRRPVCVLPGRKPRRQVFSWRGSNCFSQVETVNLSDLLFTELSRWWWEVDINLTCDLETIFGIKLGNSGVYSVSNQSINQCVKNFWHSKCTLNTLSSICRRQFRIIVWQNH